MAGHNVGTLRARMGLDASSFNRGLKGVEGSARGLASRLARTMARAGAVAVAAAGVGSAALARQSLQFIDQQAKVARTIDGTIDGLRALQMAAGDAGVGQSDLNKSMQMMSARLVEAQVKGGATADALERIGLSAASLSRMDADERLATIADRMQELGFTSGQASQFLMDMGVRSKEMALLLTQGGDAIRAARQEVDDLGLSLSSVDAAKVEAANDALSRIKLVTEAVGNRMAVAFAPALERMAVAFTSAMREGGLLRAVIDGLGQNVDRITSYVAGFAAVMAGKFAFAVGAVAVKAVAGLTLSFAGLRGAIIRTGFGALIVGAGELILWFGRLVSGAGGFGNALVLLKNVAIEVFDRIKVGVSIIPAAMRAGAASMHHWFVMKLRDMVGVFADFTWAIAEGFNSLFKTNLSGLSRGVNDELWEMEKAALKATSAAKVHLNSLKDSFSAPLESVAALREAMVTSAEDSSTAIDGVTTSVDAMNDALDQAGGSAGGGPTNIEKIKTAVEGLQERLAPLKSALSETFRGLVTGAKSGTEALRELLLKLLDIAASKVFESLWSGAFSSGGSGLGSFLGSIFGAIGSNANGTEFWRGGLTSIHERGGEIIDLPRGSRVIPHDLSKRMMKGRAGGSGTSNIRVYVDDDGNWQAKVESIAGAKAAGVTREGLSHYDRKILPGRINEISRDPRARY